MKDLPTVSVEFDTTVVYCPHCDALVLDPSGFDDGSDYRCKSCSKDFTIKEE
jgi:transposase-like protein